MADRETFVFRTKWKKQICKLSDDEAGKLIKAILEYQESGTQPELPIAADMAFSFIGAELDENNRKYEETCRKRSEAGKQGGRPPGKAKKANAFLGKQDDTPPPGDSECDSDSECDKDTAAATARESQLQRLCQFYEANNFGVIARSHFDEMTAYLDEGTSVSLIERCMKEAVDNQRGAPTWSYTKKVIERCIKQNIITVEQFEAEKRAKSAEREAVKSPGGKSGAAATRKSNAEIAKELMQGGMQLDA